ncbi:hypothetical protein K435DRAFT_866085 [Dendrothele bispora CBS 962.96]|uniref:Uncharacterized protein n=1 Tax=Dendrothele bispora (strain CBS 962.96) TaxID=1314807 RepID=A0A4S8LHV9_DENBC|nr:hypothetical protein K435DRAFT_866085 [Dendrothele bispora CBS 962.96]
MPAEHTDLVCKPCPKSSLYKKLDKKARTQKERDFKDALKTSAVKLDKKEKRQNLTLADWLLIIQAECVKYFAKHGEEALFFNQTMLSCHLNKTSWKKDQDLLKNDAPNVLRVLKWRRLFGTGVRAWK